MAGIPGRRHQQGADTRATATIGMLTRKTGAEPEVLEQEPAEDRAEGGAGTGETGPDGDGLGPLLGREDVGDDREGGAALIIAAPTPMIDRVAIAARARWRTRR